MHLDVLGLLQPGENIALIGAGKLASLYQAALAVHHHKAALQDGAAITLAGLARENSRGAHYREDFPDEGDLDASYFTVITQKGSDLTVRRDAVQFTIIRPGETILPETEPETLVAAQ